MKLIWVVFAGVVGFFTARRLTSLYMKIKTRKNNKIESERLMQSRNQTMRLSELRTLNDRLDRSKDETNSLEKSALATTLLSSIPNCLLTISCNFLSVVSSDIIMFLLKLNLNKSHIQL